jgi:peptidoglycan-associated lipoprotein
MVRRETLWIAVLLAVGATLVGCSKKPPITAAEEAVEPSPAASTPGATTQAGPTDPWDGDLDAVNELAYRQGLLGHVYFAFDEATLDPAARARLEQNIHFLAEHPQFLVLVEGHCDERGTHEYNLALGDRRAGVTRQLLAERGIDPSRVQVISYGKEKPWCAESAEACWSKNRRAHFTIAGRTTPS